MTKLYENARISVKLTDEQSANFDNSREKILSHAMKVLGNQSEYNILSSETSTADEVEEAATKTLMYDYLSEHHSHDLTETIMRLNGGYRMSRGMSADVEAARMFAKNELINNREHAMKVGVKSIQCDHSVEMKYRNRYSGNDWNITIIGEMPEQIGMCRYA